MLSDRFLDKVQFEPNTGCWLWVGAISSNGYGCIAVDGRTQRAHRISYQAHKGQIPAELEIDHLCRVRNCVNPDHLEAVTRSENVKRSPLTGKAKRERTHCKHGHEYTTENTYWHPKGYRKCRRCYRAQNLKYYHRTATVKALIAESEE